MEVMKLLVMEPHDWEISVLVTLRSKLRFPWAAQSIEHGIKHSTLVVLSLFSVVKMTT